MTISITIKNHNSEPGFAFRVFTEDKNVGFPEWIKKTEIGIVKANTESSVINLWDTRRIVLEEVLPETKP